MTDDTDGDNGTEQDWFDASRTTAEPEEPASSPPFDTESASWFDDVAMEPAPTPEAEPTGSGGSADEPRSPDVEIATNGQVDPEDADGATADRSAQTGVGDTEGAARQAVVDGAMKREEVDATRPDRATGGSENQTASESEPAAADGATAKAAGDEAGAGEASTEPADQGTAGGESSRETADSDDESSAGERSPRTPTAGSTPGHERSGVGGTRPADERARGEGSSPGRSPGDGSRGEHEDGGLLASIVAAIRSLFGGS